MHLIWNLLQNLVFIYCLENSEIRTLITACFSWRSTAQIPAFYMDTSHLFNTQHARLAPPSLAQQQGFQPGLSQVISKTSSILCLFLRISVVIIVTLEQNNRLWNYKLRMITLIFYKQNFKISPNLPELNINNVE